VKYLLAAMGGGGAVGGTVAMAMRRNSLGDLNIPERTSGTGRWHRGW
jgi:hypothetical protein